MANENRLIDANALKAEFPVIGNFKDDLWHSATVRLAIDNAPTVASAEVASSCEDPNTEYITFPDGLRLIIREGKYAGWYVCK